MRGCSMGTSPPSDGNEKHGSAGAYPHVAAALSSFKPCVASFEFGVRRERADGRAQYQPIYRVVKRSARLLGCSEMERISPDAPGGARRRSPAATLDWGAHGRARDHR